MIVFCWKEYEKTILDSKNETKDYFSKAREQILKDIDKKRKVLENEINEEIKKAEKEIIDLKNKSPEKINKIAVEASSDLVKQLIGVEVNNSSISAIVEDVSRKVKEKNYGIWCNILGRCFFCIIFCRVNIFKSSSKNKWVTK